MVSQGEKQVKIGFLNQFCGGWTLFLYNYGTCTLVLKSGAECHVSENAQNSNSLHNC